MSRSWIPSGPKLFFPNIIFKLIRPTTPLPPNQAIFKVPPRLNKFDIRTYLERLYQINVVDVRTANYETKTGGIDPITRKTRRQAAYKKVFVTMDEDFYFPNPPTDVDLTFEDRYRKLMDEQRIKKRRERAIRNQKK